MIVSIRGIVRESFPLQVVIEVGGMGYEVNIPLSTAERIPRIGEEVKLHTFAVYREDSQALYGFKSKEDRDFFRMLVEKVSGIGPKIGLSIMSRMSVEVLKDAIARGDIGLLSKCPGIGKKTAERVTIELRDKVFPGGGSKMVGFSGEMSAEGVAGSAHGDAVKALVTLGYSPAVADKSVRKALATFKDEEPETELLIKRALG